jgi:hypothetical protein
MHLGVEWPGLGRIAKRCDRLRVAPLPRERDPEVERSIRLLETAREHETKRALGLGEFLLLEVSPAVGEVVGLNRNSANAR